MAANSRTFGFELTGFEEMIAMLKRVDASIRDEVAIDAVKAGCTIIQEAAKYRAPTYRGNRSKSYYRYGRKPGKLSESIKIKMLPSLIKGTAAGAIVVGDNLGHLLEFGHATRQGKKLERNIFSKFRKGRHKKGGKIFVSPKPYMRPAIDESMKDVEREMIKIISNGLGLK